MRSHASALRRGYQVCDDRKRLRSLELGPIQAVGKWVRGLKNLFKQRHDTIVATAVAGDDQAKSITGVQEPFA